MKDNIDINREKWLDFDAFKKKHVRKNVIESSNMVLEKVPTPLVSVMILTYQHINYVRETIESVLMQKTNFPFEIILGDDESSDGTREICEEYAKKYPNKIRFFRHTRANNIKIGGKPSHLFQFVYNLFNLRGKYINILSGDDYWTDFEKLQKQCDFMENNPNISYCYHDWRYYFEDESIFSEIQQSDMIQTIFGQNIFEKVPANFVNCINEDTYLKFIWQTKGDCFYLKDINPSIYRITGQNNWGIVDSIPKHNNRINTSKNILRTYKDTTFKKNAKNHLYTSILDKHYIALSKSENFVVPLIKELWENNLIATFVSRQFVKRFRK